MTTSLSEVSGTTSWIQKMNAVPLLDVEQEKRLAIAWRDHHDRDAARQLVLSHARMVFPIVRAYRGYGLPEDDLIQQGNIGLMKAVSKFDPERGYRLASYAIAWIKAEIQQYILDNWSLVKLVTTKAHKKIFFNRAALSDGLKPLDNEGRRQLAERFDVRVEDIKDMEERLACNFESLDEPVADGMLLLDVIPAPEHDVDEIEFREMVDSGIIEVGLEALDERSRNIIRRRWIDQNATLSELATQYAVSTERIRQIEVNGLAKMKTVLESMRQKLLK